MKVVCAQKEDGNFIQEMSAEDQLLRKWHHNPVTYGVIRGTADLPGNYPERLATNLMMTTWDARMKLDLKWVPGSENPDITIAFHEEEEDDYLKTHPGVLAYAYYPGSSMSGIIVFNDKYVWGMKEGDIRVVNPDGSQAIVKVYNLLHTLGHEIGHSLGLDHDHENKWSMLYPAYNGVLVLHENDVFRIIQLYGYRGGSSRLIRWLRHRRVRFDSTWNSRNP